MKIAAALLLLPAVLVSACATQLAPVKVTETGANSYLVVAESEYSVSQAQKHAIQQARKVCGAKQLDVMPDTNLSKYQAGFGKVTYNLAFTCAKLGATR